MTSTPLITFFHFRYNKIAGQIKKIANKLSLLDPRDEFKDKIADALLSKLYSMGIISAKKTLSQCDKVTVAAFCRYEIIKTSWNNVLSNSLLISRRRLPVVLVRLRMAETVKVLIIKQAHLFILSCKPFSLSHPLRIGSGYTGWTGTYSSRPWNRHWSCIPSHP